MCRFRFVIPANLPDIHIQEAIEQHHQAVQSEFEAAFPDHRRPPSVEETSNWLLMGRSITPWVATIGAVVRTSVSKAAHELQVTLPARSCNDFQTHLAEKVVDHVRREHQLADHRRIEPDGRLLLIPYTHYGSAVGPRGQNIKRVFNNAARLVWSTAPGYELDGVFEFWVPHTTWSRSIEGRAKNAYANIEFAADYP